MDDTSRRALFTELDFERMAGTGAEMRAAEIIMARLRGMGLEPSIEAFPVNTFHPGTARLSSGGRDWDLNPYGLQGDCVIEGELRFLENPEILAFNTGAYQGVIALCYGSSLRTHELLWEGKVKALVDISGPHREAASLSHRQKRYTDGRAVPALTARYDDAESLAGLDGKSVRIEVHQKVEAATAHNIVAALGAPDRDTTLAWLVAHYDSVARSRGAVDNAAGVVTLLDAIDRLRGAALRRELRVVFFSGEELGLLGSWAYVKAHEEELKSRGRLAVNVDLAGEPIGVDSLFVTGTRELMGWAAGVCREDGLVMRENLDIYSSDNMPFAVHEVPSISIARTEGRGSFFIHTPGDVAANLSPAGIENPSRAARAILGRVMEAAVFPVRREIDDSLREKIEKYVWSSTLEKPELKWVEKYRK
jgi:hypothetical protein